MQKNIRMNDKPKTPIILYIASGLSFIPLVGIFVGLIVILFGAIGKFKNKILIIIGSCGILFSIILYSSLFYFGFKHRGGIFDDLTVQMVENQLTTIVKELEYYKIQHNVYPDSLNRLNTNNSFIFIDDPILQKMDMNNKNTGYYYQVSDSGYYLFSVGFDGKPFTNDDIFPKISCNEAAKIGILKCIMDSSSTINNKEIDSLQ